MGWLLLYGHIGSTMTSAELFIHSILICKSRSRGTGRGVHLPANTCRIRTFPSSAQVEMYIYLFCHRSAYTSTTGHSSHPPQGLRAVWFLAKGAYSLRGCQGLDNSFYPRAVNAVK
eukprot:2426624-Amphidinium_carterae.1